MNLNLGRSTNPHNLFNLFFEKNYRITNVKYRSAFYKKLEN